MSVGLHEWPLVGAEAMRALDRHTIEKLGVPGELLMECAGRLVAALAEAERAPGARVWVLCGPGSNGGDGLVAARHLQLRGVPVTVVLIGDPARVRGDAARNLERAERAGVALAGARWRAEPGDVLVDALFGTGLARSLEGEAAAAVKRVLAARPHCRVLAVDLPSGLDADTGQPTGPCVAADVTVTLGLPKLGLALEPGRSLAGRVVVGRIGIADEAPGTPLLASLLTRRGAGALLPARPADGHKGSFGHVLVAAGSRGKAGAAALAALGAARSGAGLVTVACPEGVNAILQAKLSEAMTAPLPESPDGELAPAAAEPLLALARARDVLALGPGLGRGDAPRELVRRVVARAPVPVVLDADGLVAFAGEPEALAGVPGGGAADAAPGRGRGAARGGRRRDQPGSRRSGAAARRAERCVRGAEGRRDGGGRAGRPRAREPDGGAAPRDRRHRRRAGGRPRRAPRPGPRALRRGFGRELPARRRRRSAGALRRLGRRSRERARRRAARRRGGAARRRARARHRPAGGIDALAFPEP